MQPERPTDTNSEQTDHGRRFIFTRMVPTAVIVFFILFTFFPHFGNPVSNLRRLGQGDARLSSEQKKQSALTVATGLQQLQASGQLGSFLQVSGGGTNSQTLSWDEQLHLLTISNGNTVDLGSLVAAGGQKLTKSGNTLGLEGTATTVDLASYLDNTDAQTLSLNGSALTVSGGNSINLAPINTDSQNLSLSGTTLNISGGAGVDIASINTDVLAGLSCSVGQVVQWDGSAWGCASPAASSDAQTLNLTGNNLSILNGNSVSLAGYLDNTDAQALSLGGNTLSLVNGGSVNLGAFLDNTDVLAGLSCSPNQIPKWNGSAWACAADNDTTTNESQVDAWVANNGYLVSEVDGSTSNELQTLSWNGGTHILTISSGNTADLGSLLDNTDAQAISRTGNTISITGSASTVDLSPYLDNTDAQAISKTGNTLSITGNASTVDLASYLDNTDAQTLGLAGTTLTVSGGNSIDLAPINTDSQTLSLAGTNLSVSGGNTINIASINTDVLAGLSCTTNQIAKWNGSAWACAADVDTVLNEAQVDAYANNNGYLTSEVDGSITNEIQSLSLVADVLSVSGGNSVNLASYLDNTDAQTLSWNSGTAILTIAGGNTANLSSLLDNTDAQAISKTGNTLSITGNASTVDLSGYLDNTDTLASLSCSNSQVAQWNGSAWVCANAAVDTDQQTLSLASNNLSISGGNSVSLASYLDNTDAQAILKAGNILSISGNASTVDLASYLDNTDSQALSLGGNTLSLVNGGSVNLAAYLDNTDVLAGLSCSNNQIPKWNGSAWACAADVDTVLNEAQVDAYANNNGYLTSEVDGSTSNELQTLTWNSGTHILTISSGNTADLGSLLDNTDAQAISKTGNTLSITGNASTVDLASYLDNTDSQTLGLAGTTLTVSGGNSIDLAPINTDSQNLSLTGTTLNISGGTGVDIASINTDVLASLSCSTNQIAKWNGSVWACAADVDTNTDAQTLSLAFDNLSILNGNSVSLAGYLDNTDSQTLSYNTGTHIISISGGNTQDLSNLLDNTDSQAISRAGDTLSITGNASTVDLSGYLDNTDSQAISKAGNAINISGNASTVDLSGYLDNTDVLASLSCGTNQIAKWNGSAWACAADLDTNTDAQTLNLASNNLSISNGNSVSLAGYLDNTDAQAISVASNILSISGNAGTVNLAPYLDNTDSQALSLGGNTLSLVNGGSVNLAPYLDNTDVLASLSCGTNQIAKWNGSVWACAADNDTTTNEAQVDAWVANNGYLTSEADGSTSNELQTLSWNGGTHILTISSGNTADLGSLLDNTDAQTISRTGNTISITGSVGTVDLSPYLDNTDAQAISKAANTLSISGNASTVDLASYLDNTDAQTVGLASTTLTISGGNSIDLAPINTDSQNLSLAGTTLNISGGTGVNLASINTDVLAGLSCGTNQIAKWNGSAWACAADVDTDTVLNEGQVDTYVANNGYLTSEVDGSVSNEIQALSLVANVLSISGDPGTVNLASYLDNTDSQTLSYNTGTHIISISGGNTQDLSNLLDNTDAQAISKAGNTLSITGNASTVNLAPYLDNTDVLAGLSCSTNQIAKWNGSLWACAADVDTVLNEGQVDTYVANNGYLTSETDGVVGNEVTNATASGGLTRSGSGTGGSPYTLGISAGGVTNAMLVNSGLTVSAGNGLANGGSVSLGGTTTLNIGAGNGITVNADDIAVRAAASADGLSSTTSSGSGLEVLASGVALLQGCSDTQILKWNETTDTWACAADAGLTSEVDGIVGNEVTDATVSGGLTRSGSGTGGSPYTLGIGTGAVTNAMLTSSALTISAGNGLTNGGAVSLGGTTTLNIGAGTGITVNADDIAITADGLNFTELSDTLALDAATTITLGANNLTTNVNSTGTYALQANGNTVLQVLNSGAVTIGNILSDQTIGIDNGTGGINIATDSDANTTNIGTGTGADTVTIGDSNANVSLTDAQWSITGAGAANFASTTGSGLTDCKQQNSKLLWDSSTGQFSCGTDRASVSIRKSANETVTSSFTLQDDNELLFAVGANETWVYDISYIYTTGASATPDIRVGVNGPTGASCVYQVNDIAHAGNASSGATACNTSLSVTTTATGTKGGVVTGSVTTSATAGNVAFRWAQNTSSATSTVVVAGSSLVAYKLTGADYAETYYSTDSSIQKGQLVELEGNGRSQVKKASQSYSDRVLGIVSTQPGQVVGAADGYGKPVQIALAGRVPIKLSTENGLPKAGDMITSSAIMPGYGMKATKSGNVFGQLMLDATDNGDGTADGFVFVRNGYWQAPVTIDLSTVFGSGTATNIGAQNASEVAVLGLSRDMAATYSGFDQSVVDTIMQGFSLQQDQITSLDTRLKAIEDSNLGVLSADSLARLDDGVLRLMNDVHFAGTASFDNPVLASADSAGVITIPAGADQGVITFKRAYAGVPKVVVSPNSFVDSKWRIKDVTKDSFTIQLSDKLTEEVEFTWQAVLTQ